MLELKIEDNIGHWGVGPEGRAVALCTGPHQWPPRVERKIYYFQSHMYQFIWTRPSNQSLSLSWQMQLYSSASLHGVCVKHFFAKTKKWPGDKVHNRSAIFRAEAHLKQLETFNRFFLETISHLAQQSKNTSQYITKVVRVPCMSEDDFNWYLRHPLPNTGQPHKSHSKSSNASNETASKADPSTCWKRRQSMEQYLPMQIPAALWFATATFQ